jgi:adenine-specific DNA glycosylase
LGRVPTAAELEASANEMIDRDDPAGWNQAIMDLGALRCRPKAPRCDGCPVAAWCLDPSVYEAPPRQSRYEGSTRQARAAVLRAIATHGPAAVGALAGHTSLPLERVEAAIGSLLADGTVARRHHDEAYYVRCDEATNSEQTMAEGKVITEIGLAVVKPAEFVIFRISQAAGIGQ